MGVILTAALFFAAFSVAQAQQPLPREEALKAAIQLCRQLPIPKMLETLHSHRP